MTFEAALREIRVAGALYGQAVDLLADLRAQAERAPDAACLRVPPRLRRGALPLGAAPLPGVGPRGARAQGAPRLASRAGCDALFQDDLRDRLDAEPRGFTHRDYQSRNLMVKDGELVVIDFQDALRGPAPVRSGGAAERQLRRARPALHRADARPLPRRLPARRPASGSTATASGRIRSAHACSASSRTRAGSSSSPG